jgi:hypothetical protein
LPEPTVTDRGVFWHPVGADDDDLLVTREIFPLAAALERIRRALPALLDAQRRLGERIASVFHCA